MSTSLPNVLHVVDSLETGGLERIVTDLSFAQRDRGQQVAVFSLLKTNGFRERLQAQGIPVIIGDKTGSFDRALISAIHREVGARSIDVIHSHGFVPNYYSAAAVAGRWRSPAIVNTCHDMGARLTNRKLRWMYRASLLRTARVVMVGQQVHDRFIELGVTSTANSCVIRNGIPVDRFTPGEARRLAARRTLGLSPAQRVIGAVGRLVALKNHHALIDALADLMPRHPDLTLALIGDGPLAAELAEHARQRGVERNVLFAGARADVEDLLAAFDVFALPSLTEGLSIALLEACASGLPIVASRVGGNPEIIDDQNRGLLVPVADTAALTATLDRLLGDPALRARLAQAARDWVTRNASIAVMADQYADLYQSVSKR